MLLLGLTGSIATGKSTVSALLSSALYNLPLIDADMLARQVVEPGTPGYQAILTHFGASTPGLVKDDGSGALDRGILGRRVFGNSPERQADRKVLNGIIHPLVRRETYRAILRAWVAGHWAVVLDVPLLFEAGMDLICGGVIVVAVDEETQMQRLMARDAAAGLTEEDARHRVRSQWSVKEKSALARHMFGDRAWIVDNSGDLEDLKREVARVVAEAERGRAAIWRWIWGLPPLVAVYGIAVVLGNWWRRRQWDRSKKQAEASKAKL